MMSKKSLPKNPPKILFLVEGENEDNYLRYMNFLGTRMIFNLWQATPQKMNGLLRKLLHDEQVIVIADTDVLSESQRFIGNIREIANHCRLKPIICLQIKNFEDELCFSSGCSQKDLFNHFNAQGINEFKGNFNNEKIRLPTKLNGISHDIDKIWVCSQSHLPNDLASLISFIRLENQDFPRRR